VTPGMARRLAELDDEWKLYGACRDKDVNLWYEFDGSPVEEQERAKFCQNACKVIDKCLLWALYLPETHGVWGGKTEDERKQLLLQFKADKKRQKIERSKELLDTAV
jgi:WhiB family transcriptional regulator, redox-sensing transcriptional regulator